MHNKNTRLKLLKTNSAIWFNKICKIENLKGAFVGNKNISVVKMHGATIKNANPLSAKTKTPMLTETAHLPGSPIHYH